MNIEINHSPSFSTLDLQLDQGEGIIAQPNSMLCMTTGIEISAAAGRTAGSHGMIGGVKSMLSGEGFFSAIYEAKSDGQRLSLAPEALGEILQLPVGSGTGFYLTRGAYLASTTEVKLKVKYGGVKGVMAKKGLFLLHAAGEGDVFCASFGKIITRELAPGERLILDNRFMIAFSDTIEYQLVKATKSLRHSFFSGSGLVNRYTGPGILHYQTRSNPATGVLGRVADLAT